VTSREPFARLVEAHQQAVRAFLRRLCGDRAEADDLAQEVFIAAWTGLDSFRPWSCKNVLAVALTPRDIGDVAVCGHFQRLVDFSAWNLF
jgi:RNA polymerase sigma factor (sigma-70 family)